MQIRHPRAQRVDLPRRRFVEGLAAAGAASGLGMLPRTGWAQQGVGQPAALRGPEFNLVIAETAANFTGRVHLATAVNGSVPAPILHWREGDTVTLARAEASPWLPKHVAERFLKCWMAWILKWTRLRSHAR